MKDRDPPRPHELGGNGTSARPEARSRTQHTGRTKGDPRFLPHVPAERFLCTYRFAPLPAIHASVNTTEPSALPAPPAEVLRFALRKENACSVQ